MLGLLDRETGHEVWRYALVYGTVGPMPVKHEFAHGIQQFSKTSKGIGGGSRQSESPSAPSPSGRSSDRQVTPQ